MRRAWPVLLLLSGCVDGAQPLSPTSLSDAGPPADAAQPTDAGEPAGPISVFDPRATLRTPEVVTAFAPTDAARPVMQGSPFRLVWTGAAYVIFWVENAGGRLRAVRRTLAPTLGPIQELLPEPPTHPDDVMQFRPLALVEGRRVALVWHTRRSVQMAWTDLQGELVQGPVTVREYSGANRHYASLIAPDLGQAAYVLFGYEVRGDDALRVTRIGPGGELFGLREVPDVFPDDPIDLGAVTMSPAGYGLTWSSRNPGPNSPDEVWYQELGFFEPIRRVGLLQRENLTARIAWPEGAPEFSAVAEYGVGLQLVDFDGRVRRTVPARVWSQVVPEAGGRRLGILAQTGDVDPVGGLPSGLSYSAWDPDTDELSPPVSIQAADGRCVERAEGVAAGDRIGVAWVMGCSRRTLYFTELRTR